MKLTKRSTFKFFGMLLLLGLGIFVFKYGCGKREYHPFLFTYSSVYGKQVHIDSVRILSRDVRNGVRSGVHRMGSYGAARNDCTPEALLGTTANFVWWHEDPEDPYSHVPPKNPADRFSHAIAFPQMDAQAYEWRCHFTLQPDNTWVGQYEGSKLKPIGENSEKYNLSTVKPEQRWICFQFQNLTDTAVRFSYRSEKLITGESETQMFFRVVPADGKFHGFTCHCDENSIYRPHSGSKIKFEWAPARKNSQKRLETFDLPTFSRNSRNWYCYFILDKNGKWSATFEGVAESKKNAGDLGAAK